MSIVAFNMAEWKISEIEKKIGREIPPGFHSMRKGFLEYDNTRNGCAFDSWPSFLNKKTHPPKNIPIIKKGSK